MLAVIQTGGKQYKVSEKQTLQVEKLEGQKGDVLQFDQVLLTANDAGEVKIGSPLVTGAKVEAKIMETGKAKKIDVIKFKSKVRYRRKIGHRQPFTKISIEKITV